MTHLKIESVSVLRMNANGPGLDTRNSRLCWRAKMSSAQEEGGRFRNGVCRDVMVFDMVGMRCSTVLRDSLEFQKTGMVWFSEFTFTSE
mmetsp:Transcript_175/g.278  ORF Transcript_175/g.278 Transcript_175/m.278 type:complete len:89 (+) Transcript_175:1656-1922(+)